MNKYWKKINKLKGEDRSTYRGSLAAVSASWITSLLFIANNDLDHDLKALKGDSRRRPNQKNWLIRQYNVFPFTYIKAK